VGSRHAMRAARGAALCVAAVAVAHTARAAADRLVLLDGSAIQDTVKAIDAKGLVHRASGKPPLDLQALRRIERPAKPSPAKPAPCEVHLVAGGSIQAADVAFQKETFTVRWAYGKALALPLAAVRGLRLGSLPGAKPGAAPPAFDASLRAQEVRRDELFAIANGKVQVVRGGLQAVGAKQVAFYWNDAERQVGRAKVYGVVLAHRGPRPELAGQCLARLADGSSLWVADARVDGGRLQGRVGGEVAVSLPWTAVRRLDVRSTRMAFLSDLEPVEAVEEALVTYPGPWRRDRNVVGGPLVVGGKEFEKGLGVHARCRLTYDLGGRYDAFAATIGVDASASGRGDCVFVVSADGRELFRKRLRGTDRPAAVRLKLAKAKRLTLLVEWGEDLDLADRANWCDARVLKQEDAK